MEELKKIETHDLKPFNIYNLKSVLYEKEEVMNFFQTAKIGKYIKS